MWEGNFLSDSAEECLGKPLTDIVVTLAGFETRNYVCVRSASLFLCDAASVTLTAGTPDLLLVVLRCFK